MKRILLSFFTALIALSANAQVADCEADYNFGEEPYGIAPNPNADESFALAVIDVPYFDVIHMKIPQDASEFELEGVPAGISIDSIALVSAVFTLAGTDYTLEQMGLELQCNNNGDSPNPCTFLGGSQYCATLSGTPTIPGVFDIRIDLNAYFDLFFQVIEFPVSSDLFTDEWVFTVATEVNVPKAPAYALSLGQNYPNPATDITRIPVVLETAGNVNFTVVNLLGEVVVREQYSGHAGANDFTYTVTDLPAGIYLYSIDVNGKRFTKRMIVNR
jgi:hypothetical protein